MHCVCMPSVRLVIHDLELTFEVDQPISMTFAKSNRQSTQEFGKEVLSFPEEVHVESPPPAGVPFPEEVHVESTPPTVFPKSLEHQSSEFSNDSEPHALWGQTNQGPHPSRPDAKMRNKTQNSKF